MGLIHISSKFRFWHENYHLFGKQVHVNRYQMTGGHGHGAVTGETIENRSVGAVHVVRHKHGLIAIDIAIIAERAISRGHLDIDVARPAIPVLNRNGRIDQVPIILGRMCICMSCQ